MKGRPIDWQPEEIAWVAARADWPRRELWQGFCGFWQRDGITLQAFKAMCKRERIMTGRDGRLQKGNVPPNKGRKGYAAPGSELGQIADLPVAAIAGDNALLWLWATNPMLPVALELLSLWGFAFKTAGHWSKKTRHGRQAFGTGYILRCAGEPFLIGTRGKPVTERSVRSVIEGPVREHSRKPDEAFAAAEALMPGARRIELFSRQNRPGWVTWGNEVGKFGEVA